jgi:hypothetical protein
MENTNEKFFGFSNTYSHNYLVYVNPSFAQDQGLTFQLAKLPWMYKLPVVRYTLQIQRKAPYP